MTIFNNFSSIFFFTIISALLMLSLSSCSKKEPDPQSDQDNYYQQELSDELVGTYEGIYIRKKQVFDCGIDCYPPCDEIMSHDTFQISIVVEKINSNSVRIIDNQFERVDSEITVSYEKTHEGPSQSNNAYLLDLSELEVHWTGTSSDSLYIDHNYGAGGNCGGTFYYDKYRLKK